MENVANRIDCNLVRTEKQFVKNCSKPTFKNYKIITADKVAVCEQRKTCVVYDKPMIVGMSILDLSKTLMYNFHYNTIKKNYGEKAKLIFTDTDSLCYNIETEDVYRDMEKEKHKYDFSDYHKGHFLFSEENKKAQGVFKEEANGKIISEICALRAKLYAFIIHLQNRTATIIKNHFELEKEVKTKVTCKGVKTATAKKFKLEQYRTALFGHAESYKIDLNDERCSKQNFQQTFKFNLIRQTNHNVHSITVNKIGISGLDDKRYVCADNVNTLAWGHCKISQDYSSENYKKSLTM
jgi:hypothetical protein